MMEPIHFSRKPYTVIYKDFHTDDLVKVRRRPPEKLNDILPTDVVELNVKKNEYFDEEESYTVKSMNSRAPNVLQLIDDDTTTFVSSFDASLEEMNGYRREDGVDDEKKNRYLTWP